MNIWTDIRYCATAFSVKQFILLYVQIILLKLFIQYVHIHTNQYVTTSAVETCWKTRTQKWWMERKAKAKVDYLPLLIWFHWIWSLDSPTCRCDYLSTEASWIQQKSLCRQGPRRQQNYQTQNPNTSLSRWQNKLLWNENSLSTWMILQTPAEHLFQ